MQQRAQHDDHTILTFEGVNYWIRKRGRDRLLLVNDEQWVIVDISAARWDEYCVAAVQMIEDKRGTWE
jgi:hypothetical protein